MVQWFQNLTSTLDETWSHLSRGIADRRAPARHPTLATVGRDGGAEARTVVLRSADRSTDTLEAFTDTATSKLEEIRSAPRVTLHIWQPRVRLQIRLRAAATIVTGSAVAEVWTTLSTASRRDYGRQPAPGTPIDTPEDHRTSGEAGRFAVLRFTLAEIETLHLGREQHYRALFRRADGWSGTWLAP
jgi:hypothetical protein